MINSLSTTPCSTHHITPKVDEPTGFYQLALHPLGSPEAFEEFLCELQGHPPFIILRDQRNNQDPQKQEPESIESPLKVQFYEQQPRDFIGDQARYVLNFLIERNLPRLQLKLLLQERKVSRRRATEILSIFESLTMVRKTRYGLYDWFGTEALQSVLHAYRPRFTAFSFVSEGIIQHSETTYIASKVIELFEHESRNWLLNEMVMGVMDILHKSNFETCRKRVYDTLAVFRQLGLVNKRKGKNLRSAIYQWKGFAGFYDRQQVKFESDDERSIFEEGRKDNDSSQNKGEKARMTEQCRGKKQNKKAKKGCSATKTPKSHPKAI